MNHPPTTLDPLTTARAYLDTWNATDATARRALLERHWTDTARYVDPLARADGAAQIDGLVGAVQQRFPDFRFTLRGTPDGHGEHLRLAWSLGPAGTADAPIEGSDVVVLRDGRIDQVIGFIDKAPAAT